MLHLPPDGGDRLITHESLSESLAVMQHQEAQPKPCVRPPAIDYDKWSRMIEIWNGIGPNARDAWMMIGERLLMGRKQYNDDFDADRDTVKDCIEEVADLAVYAHVQLMKSRR